MPIETSIDPIVNLVTFKVTGDISDLEYFAAFANQFKHPSFKESMANMWVLENVTFSSHDKNSVQQNMKSERKLGLLSKISKAAWVAPSDIEFGTARQFEIMTNDPSSATDREVKIFRNVGDALQWLKT